MAEALSRDVSPILSTKESKSNIQVESIVEYASSECVVATKGLKRLIRSEKSSIARHRLLFFVFRTLRSKIHV